MSIGAHGTCLTDDRVSSADGYLRLATSADQGHGGVELWISDQYPAAWHKKKPLFWDPTSVAVTHRDAHLLIVTLLLPGVSRFAIAVGHAPHTGHTEEKRQAWWDKLHSLLRPLQAKHRTILLLDANAQIGAHTSPHVGDFFPSDEDLNGECLHSLLELTNTYLPATFHHTGDPCTWYSNAAKERTGRRIDFIGWPLDMNNGPIASWTEASLDAGHRSIDHLAVALHVQGSFTGKTLAKASYDGIDWQEVRRQSDESTWRQIFSDLPYIPWNYDPHLHGLKHTGISQRPYRPIFPGSHVLQRRPTYPMKHGL